MNYTTGHSPTNEPEEIIVSRKVKRKLRENSTEFDEEIDEVREIANTNKPRKHSSRGYDYRSGHSPNPEDGHIDIRNERNIAAPTAFSTHNRTQADDSMFGEEHDQFEYTPQSKVNIQEARSTYGQNAPYNTQIDDKIYSQNGGDLDQQAEIFVQTTNDQLNDTNRGFTQTFIRQYDPRPGQGYTIEKTVVTLHGAEPCTERERQLLKDQVEQQIQESQALVEELMQSNRRHAEKLHSTLNDINDEYNTPAKK